MSSSYSALRKRFVELRGQLKSPLLTSACQQRIMRELSAVVKQMKALDEVMSGSGTNYKPITE